ncbi:MAG TPA: class F sortase [Actinotalea sp.]
MTRTLRGVHAATAVLLIAAVVGLAACSTAPPRTEESHASSVVPGPSLAAPHDAVPTPTLPEVPVRSADLGPVVHPPAPVSLRLAALGIELPVDPVGVTADGQMEIPPLAERGGWYRFGATPGDRTGTAVIAAHVDSVASAGLGPFAHLRDLAVGDLVDITLGDGSVLHYAVTAVTVVPKPEIAWSDVFTRDGRHHLVLITCGGRFDRAARHYEDNVIVTADPVGG